MIETFFVNGVKNAGHPEYVHTDGVDQPPATGHGFLGCRIALADVS
jgi:transketolase